MTSNYSSRILKWQPLSTNSVWKWFADPIIAGSQPGMIQKISAAVSGSGDPLKISQSPSFR